jgi:hypothetical protein
MGPARGHDPLGNKAADWTYGCRISAVGLRQLGVLVAVGVHPLLADAVGYLRVVRDGCVYNVNRFFTR